MAELFAPFDAGAGTGVLESTWQKMARSWLSTGVLTGRLNQLAVSASGGALSVSVASGQAQVEGFFYESDAAKAITIPAANATNPRIDTIVVRLDRTTNTITSLVVPGTAAASPVQPTLNATDLLYDLPLADVLVPAAAGVIVAGNVTDRRALVKNVTEEAPLHSRCFRTGAINAANAVTTVIPLDTEAFNSTGMHNLASNPERIVLPRAGLWLISGQITYGTNSAGDRKAAIYVNGAFSGQSAEASLKAAAGNLTQVQVSCVVSTTVKTDYVDLRAFQDSGGALAIGAGSTFTWLSATYLG